jgi:hypothetical protein
MTDAPYEPAVADQAVREQLANQAQAVTGVPSAGVYGDPAGASQPAQQIDLSKAAPTSADVADLLARVQAMEAAQEAARRAAEPAPLEPPDLTPRLSGSASAELHSAFAGIHDRIVAVEQDVARLLAHLGL